MKDKIARRAFKVALLRLSNIKRSLHMDYLRIKTRGGLVQKEILGSKMWLDTRDKGLAADLIIDGTRETKMMQEFSSWLGDGNVVVDIGANIGYYALLEAKKIGKGGIVYAIEPIAKNIEMLKLNIAENNYKNIETFQNAVGNENKIGKIFISQKSNLHSMLQPQSADAEAAEVEILTLDKFLRGKKKPDFVRMDVEGFEYEILQGMEKTLKTGNNLGLFIEVHPEFMGKEKTIEFFKMLQKQGFENCKIIMDLPVVMQNVAAVVSRDVFHETGEFNKKISEIIADEKFHSGVFHLFARK